MARTQVDELYVKAGVDLSTLERGLKDFERSTMSAAAKAVSHFKSIDDSVGKLERSFNGLKALAIVGVATGLGALVTKSLNAAGALQDAADATGLNVERYQELRFAAQLAGISQEQFGGAMQRFAKVVGDAAGGSDEALASFQSLGVGILDSSGNLRSQGDILEDVIKAIGQYGTQAERASASAALFGREAGVKFAGFIGQGTAEIERLVAKAREMGLVLSEDVVKRADEAGDQLETLGQVIETKLTDAIARAAPFINGLVDAIVWLLEPIAGETKVEALARQVADLDNNLSELEKRKSGGTIDLFGVSLNPEQQAEAAAYYQQQRDDLENQLSDVLEMSGRGIHLPRGGGTKNPSSKSAANKAQAAAEALQKVRDKVGDLNDALQETIDKSTEALLKRPMEALNQIEKMKADALQAYQQGEDELTAARLEKIKKVMADVEEENKQRTARIEQEWENAFDNIGHTIIDTLTDSTLSASDKMKRILFSALEDIANAAISQMGGKSPFAVLGKAAGDVLGKAIGSIIGGGTSWWGFAEGGVIGAGQMAMVGEKGPELVMPASDTRVFSNAETRSLLGGGGSMVNQTFVFNVGTGASEAAQVVRGLLPQIVAAAKSGVSADLARNGALRKQIA